MINWVLFAANIPAFLSADRVYNKKYPLRIKENRVFLKIIADDLKKTRFGAGQQKI
ncbi:hypothetical protein [Pseudochrobactrum sp. HB0163]|uniref:hypothetical protein n=1 Tax=Pseudochrobactrum sp. HB0163 TaxID=3450708 RepID=UPI003F6E2D59